VKRAIPPRSQGQSRKEPNRSFLRSSSIPENLLKSNVFDVEEIEEDDDFEKPLPDNVGTLSNSVGVRSSGQFRGSLGFRSSTSAQWQKLKTDFISEMRYVSKLRHPCVTTVMGK
jgi:hypothetical protein